jgi:16S rRNA (cytosine967-C5)-methyltransferase
MGDMQMSLSPARRVAYRVVKRVREREAFGPQTLDAVLAAASLSHEDTALATRLTYGTLQTQGVLDEAIDRVTDKPGAIEPQVRDALRITAYELLFMRTPPRAAVHEGVEMVKAVRKQAAGLANAVLRKVAASASSFPWGDPATDADALARLTGHPRWLVDLLVAELGDEDARLMLAADNEPAPLYLWHDPFVGTLVEALDALTADGADPVEYLLPGCVEARTPASAVRGEAVRRHLLEITDASAQVVALAVGGHPGGVVIDLAAGRGTKTAQLQALSVAAGGPADLFAVDIHPFKSDVLRGRMKTLGIPGVRVLTGDALDVECIGGLPAAGTADAVLLDAPCSGLGTLRRHPEKRWRVTLESIADLASLQARLLEQAASLVRVGGVVVYSTCTVACAENDDVVAGFLDSEAGEGFATRTPVAELPESLREWIGPKGWFQSQPRAGGPDGHFVAGLVRVR